MKPKAASAPEITQYDTEKEKENEKDKTEDIPSYSKFKFAFDQLLVCPTPFRSSFLFILFAIFTPIMN